VTLTAYLNRNQIPGSGISPFAFALAATNTFATAGPGCDKAISSAVNTMMTLANTQQGRKRIGEAFKLCSGTPPTPDAAYAVIDWVTNGLAGMAMLGRQPVTLFPHLTPLPSFLYL